MGLYSIPVISKGVKCGECVSRSLSRTIEMSAFNFSSSMSSSVFSILARDFLSDLDWALLDLLLLALLLFTPRPLIWNTNPTAFNRSMRSSVRKECFPSQ